jgi:hypothetical protein
MKFFLIKEYLTLLVLYGYRALLLALFIASRLRIK